MDLAAAQQEVIDQTWSEKVDLPLNFHIILKGQKIANFQLREVEGKSERNRTKHKGSHRGDPR